MIKDISKQTSLFFDQVNTKRGFQQKFNSNWKNTNKSGFYIFLACVMLMSHVIKPKLSNYWATDEFIRTPIFSNLFSRNRFWKIWKYLHFNNNKKGKPDNRLHKISPILKHINGKFKSLFNPFQKLCLDESLMLYKGRLAFKQYIPSKRHQFGVKSFILCDCQTGFILDLLVYAGKKAIITNNDDIGISGSIVMQMMQPYLNKGHQLFVDNWYSSPALFEKLQNHQTGACGTIRKNGNTFLAFQSK